MSLTMTEYRCDLIHKVRFARSEEEVRRFIAADQYRNGADTIEPAETSHPGERKEIL